MTDNSGAEESLLRELEQAEQSGLVGAMREVEGHLDVMRNGVALHRYSLAIQLRWHEVAMLLCGVRGELPPNTRLSVSDGTFVFVLTVDNSSDMNHDLASDLDEALTIAEAGVGAKKSEATVTFRTTRAELWVAMLDHAPRFPVFGRDELVVPIENEAWARVRQRWETLNEEFNEFKFMRQFEYPNESGEKV
jgi:hypothetical protein